MSQVPQRDLGYEPFRDRYFLAWMGSREKKPTRNGGESIVSWSGGNLGQGKHEPPPTPKEKKRKKQWNFVLWISQLSRRKD